MNKIDKFRKIVREHTAAKIDGTEVDGSSALAVVKVYDALSKRHQERFVLEPAQVMIWVAFDLIEKAKEGTR